MTFYLVKYRVTSANIIAQTIEPYSSEEEAESKYYEGLADAISNNKLKYVMLSIIDSEGNELKHDYVNSPGVQSIPTKYLLTDYTFKTDNTTTESVLGFDTEDAAKVKMVEKQTSAQADSTIIEYNSSIFITSVLSEHINGGGYVDYKNKYLVYINKTKNDNTLEPSIRKYDTLEAAQAYVYTTISASIKDITLYYIDCRILNTTGETLLHERKSCKGRIPVEPVEQENE